MVNDASWIDSSSSADTTSVWFSRMRGCFHGRCSGSVLRGLVSRPRLRLPGSSVTGREVSQPGYS
jgi:hypothetical protein